MKSPTYDEDEKHRRLRADLDHKVRVINREVIGDSMGAIRLEDYINLARVVAHLRARYLGSAVKLGREGTADVDIQATRELRDLRIAYREALESFDALEHAMRRGYVHLEGEL